MQHGRKHGAVDQAQTAMLGTRFQPHTARMQQRMNMRKGYTGWDHVKITWQSVLQDHRAMAAGSTFAGLQRPQG